MIHLLALEWTGWDLIAGAGALCSTIWVTAVAGLLGDLRMSRNRRRSPPTMEEMEAEDNRMAEVNARDARLSAVRQKLDAVGIEINDLIELIDEERSRGY